MEEEVSPEEQAQSFLASFGGEEALLPAKGADAVPAANREQERPATSNEKPPEVEVKKFERPQIVIPYISEEQVQELQEEAQRTTDALHASMEETADLLNTSIETVLGYRPGIGGFVLKAFRGTTVPAPDGRRIDALTDKLEALEEHYRTLRSRLDESIELLRRAKAAPDNENTKTLRWRAVQMLDYRHDQTKLVQAEQQLRAAQAAFATTLQVEVIKEEPKEKPVAKAKAPAKRLLTRSKPTA